MLGNSNEKIKWKTAFISKIYFMIPASFATRCIILIQTTYDVFRFRKLFQALKSIMQTKTRSS